MKYIVYKTTNIINNKIYVGVHKTEDPDIFDGYIGCGVYINQLSTYNNPKTIFQKAVKKYGCKNFKREIISVFNTDIEAYSLEGQIVNEEFLAREDVYNMVLGGMYHTVKTIKVFSYTLTGEYIKDYDSIVSASKDINKCAQAVWNAIIYKYSCSNLFFSTDKLDKLDLSLYNTSPTSKTVFRYLVENGKYDKEFSSLTEASKESNLTLVQVARSAKIGYRAGKYQFCYVKAPSYDKAKNIYINNRPVFKYSNDGKFIEGYDTQYHAELDNPGSNITNAIKNKKVCANNYLWSLEELPIFCAKTNTKKKKVGKFDIDGNLIYEYESKKMCIELTGVPDRYIKVGKIYKNYIYKYI